MERVEVPSAAGFVAASRGGSARIVSIDVLRGLVMALMALDHTRDFFGTGDFNPRDVMDPALFLTRWVTHFCAPTFIFLAGLSAFLYGRGRSAGELSRFLLIRGLWLILLDLTLIKFGWRFDVDLYRLTAGVIFVIGASMVALAALIWLPRWAIAAVALIMLVGHNLLDGIKAEEFGGAYWAWHVLHEPGLVPLGDGASLYVLYPLIPWIGVMAAGYLLGPVMQLERDGEAAPLVQARRGCHPRLHRPPRYQSLWRSGPVDSSGDVAFDPAILYQLRKISTLAALSDDDARARADAARFLRARAGRFRTLACHVRTSSVLLLRRPHLFDPRARRRHGPRHDRHPYENAYYWLKSRGHLFRLAPGARPALSDLPLVR